MNGRYSEKRIDFNSAILTRDCGNVTLAFNPDTSDMFEFNDTGAEIFELLKTGMQYDEVIASLCEVYDVTPADIYDDVDSILERMESTGIINVK